MKSQYILLIVAGVAVAVVTVLWYRNRDHFSEDDKLYGKRALSRLDTDGEGVVEVSEDYIKQNLDKILLVKAPLPKGAYPEDHRKEYFGVEGGKPELLHPANTRYWPDFYYTNPYRYLEGGAWPPNMYSRLYNWQPGYESTGWSYWMRPGISYVRWPRNRWVHTPSSGKYYFIDNGTEKDRIHDYMN